jgi:hypothetical protein
MSTSTVVPIFDPQGVLRDVPPEQMADAVKAGGMPSVRFQAPDGKVRFVPANQIQDAVQHGGKMLPIEQQDVQHPGFWSALIDDVKSLGKSLLNAGPEMATGDQIHQDAEYQQKLINEGRSLPYRALMSLTPNGMRESAESGDVGGVAGHTGRKCGEGCGQCLTSGCRICLAGALRSRLARYNGARLASPPSCSAIGGQNCGCYLRP